MASRPKRIAAWFVLLAARGWQPPAKLFFRKLYYPLVARAAAGRERPPGGRGRSRAVSLAGEFLRYAIVGGIAFLADFGALVASQELFLQRFACGVYVATVLGFMAGLAVNYALSLRFVFTRAEDRGRGRSFGAFAVFGVVGLAGLLLTELGMWIGTGVLAWNYMAAKVLVSGAVLAWNYLGRKLLVFGPKGIVR